MLAEKPVLVNGAPAVLNTGQLLGMLLPALNNFVLVSGGPGTGKTFIVINLLRNMARLGVPPGRMRITAPTGRAAQKLAEAVRRGIMSLADPDGQDLALASIRARPFTVFSGTARRATTSCITGTTGCRPTSSSSTRRR